MKPSLSSPDGRCKRLARVFMSIITPETFGMADLLSRDVRRP